MEETLICYTLGKTEPKNRTLLHRELYGYKDKSNHGKYDYKRQGILQKVKAKRLIDAVIITKNEHTPKLIKILKKYKAKVYVYKIVIKTH